MGDEQCKRLTAIRVGNWTGAAPQGHQQSLTLARAGGAVAVLLPLTAASATACERTFNGLRELTAAACAPVATLCASMVLRLAVCRACEDQSCAVSQLIRPSVVHNGCNRLRPGQADVTKVADPCDMLFILAWSTDGPITLTT